MYKIISKTVLALFIAFISFLNTAAAQAPVEKSLLWEISGNGLEKPSYLYGTIHIICENDFVVSDKTKKAFSNSGKLVLEANIFDPQQMAGLQKIMTADTPMNKRMSPALFSELDSIMKLKTGVPLTQLNNFKLFVVGSILAMKSMDCAKTKSYEEAFQQMSKTENKTIDALETVAGQMKMLDSTFTDQYIIDQIRTFDVQKAASAKMVQLYKEEDLGGLYSLITSTMNETALNPILFTRNAAWIQIMPSMMKEGSRFFAVGAAHLAGEKGVISLLRARGYTVKPIMK